MRIAAVAGTFDTKGPELEFVAEVLREAGIPTRTIDLSTRGAPAQADVPAQEVAERHPDGAQAVLGLEDRGRAVGAMAEAFRRYAAEADWIGGIFGAGGSGGASLVAPAMREMPVGMPRMIVTSVASGDVRPYVGASDIAMIYSIADVQGLNRISRTVLANAAAGFAGMMRAPAAVRDASGRPIVGLTMFGVTTACVSHLARALETHAEPIVFHATGIGGQSMEKLVDSGLIDAVLDLTTTEIADMIVGGALPASEDRLGAVIRTGVPYVGSCGALDMVNFGGPDTVPERFRTRKLHVHNPQVTLMRTTADENRAFGAWLAERLNRMRGPVRFLIPEGGVSAIDAPGQPFCDPEADAALFEAIESGFCEGPNRKLRRIGANLNTVAFAEAALESFREIAGETLGPN